jgi:hypothetical protein
VVLHNTVIMDELSHYKGYAFRYNRDIYYSPNSSRRFAVPPKGILPSPRYADLTQTSWLSPGFSYLALLPSIPNFPGRTCRCLQDPECISKLPDKRFGLNRQRLDQWLELETQLLDITAFLIERDDSRLVNLPPRPSACGFTETDLSYTVAKEKIRTSRDMFLLWIAAAAFLIARKEQPAGDDVPRIRSHT